MRCFLLWDRIPISTFEVKTHWHVCTTSFESLYHDHESRNISPANADIEVAVSVDVEFLESNNADHVESAPANNIPTIKANNPVKEVMPIVVTAPLVVAPITKTMPTESLWRSARVHVPSNKLHDYDYRGMPQLHSISTTNCTSPHTLSKYFITNIYLTSTTFLLVN